MTKYLIRRVLLMIPTILAVATFIFILVRTLPGDPAEVMLGDYATPELLEQMRRDFGLDQPLHIQYFRFLTNLFRGDLGNSMRNSRPVIEQIGKALPYTLQLAAGATLIAIIFGVLAGTIAAITRNSIFDNITMVMAMVAYSMPAFWLGLLLLIVFAVQLNWFPVLGAGEGSSPMTMLKYLVLPILAVGLRQAGLLARMTRSSLVEILNQDYIRTARAKGLTERSMIMIHAMKNASIPIVTIIGLSMGRLLGGTLVSEIVFTRPGLGRLLVDAVFTRDYTMLQGLVIVWGLALIITNLIVDIMYTYLDPRIEYS